MGTENMLGIFSHCSHFTDFGDASVLGHLLQSLMKQLGNMAQCCRICRQDASQVRRPMALHGSSRVVDDLRPSTSQVSNNSTSVRAEL